MADRPRVAATITALEFAPAGPRDRHAGLLGYLAMRCGPFRLEGATVRRERGGGISISWPARTDRYGYRHRYFEPVDDEAAREVERLILGKLGFLREAQGGPR